jgi:hypothetical protein
MNGFHKNEENQKKQQDKDQVFEDVGLRLLISELSR